jgi:hypothetical protein
LGEEGEQMISVKIACLLGDKLLFLVCMWKREESPGSSLPTGKRVVEGVTRRYFFGEQEAPPKFWS